MPKNEIQNGAREIGARRAKMLSRGLGDTSILDAGRASALASAAQKAEMKMFLETIIQFDSPFGSRFYQVNPATRRFRFEL